MPAVGRPIEAKISQSIPITALRASAYTIPTSTDHESDGTLRWDSTTIVLVEVDAGGKCGLGYTYYNKAAARFIAGRLTEVICGADALQVQRCWRRMLRLTRNLGEAGEVACAISAVDIALWDLKGKLVELPLSTLLDSDVRGLPVYGSGGFCSYSDGQLTEQFQGWVNQGIKAVKMKVGRHPNDDPRRVKVAREAIGPEVALFVDANGALDPKQALALAKRFADYDVTWFEEPVSSDDLDGLRMVREQGPPGMEIAAGEYGYNPWYFERMLSAGAVDVLQADATRCLGITGFLQAGILAYSHHTELSAHTAPALHAHVLGASPSHRHLEYFWDHARIERMFFDGLPELVDGKLIPNRERAGMGLVLKRADIEKYAA